MQFYPQDSKAVSNKEHLLYHLQEAREQLNDLIDNVDSLTITGNSSKYMIPCHVYFKCIYHHINLAWNTHNMPKRTLDNMSKEAYRSYAGYPLSLGIGCFPVIQDVSEVKPKKAKRALCYRKPNWIKTR